MTNELLAALDNHSSSSSDERPVTVREAAKFLGVSLPTVYLWGRAKADSPSPRNGSKYPVPQIGSRNIPRVLRTGDGECLEHASTKVLFIDGLAPKSGGFAIGIARDCPKRVKPDR